MADWQGQTEVPQAPQVTLASPPVDGNVVILWNLGIDSYLNNGGASAADNHLLTSYSVYTDANGLPWYSAKVSLPTKSSQINGFLLG